MTLDEHDQPPQADDLLAPPNRFEPAATALDPELDLSSAVPPAGEDPAWNAPALPSDLRVPWGWLDLLLLIAVAAIGTVGIEFLLVVGLAFLGISPSRLQETSGVALVAAIAAQLVIDLALLGYLAVQVRAWYHLPFWRTIGWRPIETEKFPPVIAYIGLAFVGFILIAIVSLASSAFPPAHPLPIESVFQSRPAILMYMFAAVFVAPVVEETVFRGYLYPVFARTFGVGAGVAIVGTLFGLLHAVQLWGGWWQIGLLIFVGIVLTAVRATARTVNASYVVHLVYNTAQVVAFLFATHGGHYIP